MLRNLTVGLVLGVLGAPVDAVAQATGTPSFNAPYRAFARHEFGVGLGFVDYDAGTAVEGMYRFASGQFDVGLRGGILFPDGPVDDFFLIGAEGRYRVLTHSESFPLDGALIFGGGLQIDGATIVRFPAGLSLGRRVQVENSEVSIVPYVQPTLFLVSASAGGVSDTDVHFALGLGGDFRLSRSFDARLSLGFGDLEGISIGAVWVR